MLLAGCGPGAPSTSPTEPPAAAPSEPTGRPVVQPTSPAPTPTPAATRSAAAQVTPTRPATLPTAAGPALPPLRTSAEALAAETSRLNGAQAGRDLSDLARALRTPLAESRVGFVNGHHLLESELAELGHFSFALNPLYNQASNGRQQFLIFGNSPNFLNYRSQDLGQAALQNSDRAVWAASNGYRVTTVIQIDNELSDDLLRYLVASRVQAGFRVFVVGNEFNDPGAHWRYDLDRLLRALRIVDQTIADLGVRNAEVYTPSLAFYETDRHLNELLGYIKGRSREFPADGVSQNLYGSVDSIRDHLGATLETLKRYGLADRHLQVGELGSPTDTFQTAFTDEQLAYNYFPQAIALSLSKEEVDWVYLYSAYEFGRDKFSLARLEGASLKPKDSLLAGRLAARVFARLKDVEYHAEGDLRRIEVERQDGIKLWVVWSASPTQTLTVKKPDRAEVYGALGNRLDEGEIQLTPSPHPALAGTAKYILLPD